jgi:hypothetical protein
MTLDEFKQKYKTQGIDWGTVRAGDFVRVSELKPFPEGGSNELTFFRTGENDIEEARNA